MVGARKVLVLLPLALVSACTLGPDYKRPSVTPPPAYRGVQISADQAKSVADLPWFEMFKEPELAALVREAIDRNLDLMAAVARVEEFRGRAALAGVQNRPTLDGSFATSPQPTGGDIDNAYTAGLFFNWEIDFFGRLRRLAEASQAELLASEDGARAVMSSVATSVAQLYVTLRTLDEQRAITLGTIKAQEEALRLVSAQAKGGVASETEVQQAINQLATTRSVLPKLERRTAQVENLLSIFVGRVPGGIARGSSASSLPTAPDIPAGLPSQLLERRPDIRAAEQQLHAAVARIGFAVASKIPVPRIGLTSSFGRVSTSLDDFFSGGDKAENLFSFGGFFNVPLYDGGRANARVRIANAQAEQAALNYRSVILQSLREVADSLVTIDKIRAEIGENEVRVKAATEYLRLTDLRYRGGVSSYLEVIDAQRQLFSAQLDLTDTRLVQLSGVIDLYRALGGGWSDDELKKLMEKPPSAMQ